jgi:ribosomal protein S19
MRFSLVLFRSAWRGPFVTALQPRGSPTDGPIRTDARYATVLPTHVGSTIHVHNGNSYIPVNVVEDMVGHKFGEFAATKKFVKFKDSQKKKK